MKKGEKGGEPPDIRHFQGDVRILDLAGWGKPVAWKVRRRPNKAPSGTPGLPEASLQDLAAKSEIREGQWAITDSLWST